MSTLPAVSIDYEADAAYLTLTSKAVARTCKLTDDVLVDLDEFDMVVGVELLSLAALLPVDQLITEFHVPSERLELFRETRRASVIGNLQSAFEGATKSRDEKLQAA